MKKSILSFFFSRKFLLQGILIVFSITLVFGFYNSGNKEVFKKAIAAGSCTASLNWDKSSINKGENATQSWTITGAANASGSCSDGDTINSTHDGDLSFGPQSYTFQNVQKSITCSVTGTTSDGNTCTSGPKTVTVNTPTTSGGGERCWFDAPGKTGYGFADQDSNYTVEVNADICGTVQSGGDKFGFCSGGLHWTSLNGSAWNAPALSDSDYTATLNGGSFHNKQDIKLSDGLTLTRSELLQNNIYSITIKKKSDGSTAASCSVTINASYSGAPGTGVPIGNVQPGIFPAPGNYSISSAAGLIPASFKYAPQIPGVFVPTMSGYLTPIGPSWLSGNGLGTFLGQFKKTIYYVIGHEPGAYGAWDLSDPFNPGNPSLQFIATNGGATGPVQHLWPHASHGIGAAVGESADGSARMLNKNGLAEFYGDSYVCGSDPVYGYPLICHATYKNGPTSISTHSFNGSQASFGQQIEVFNASVPVVVYATNDGNFFGYSSEGTKIDIFDLTDPTGSANPPYMKPVGTIAWQASDMHLTTIPNRDTQFLIATVGNNAVTAPTYRIGELNSSTGKIKSQKTVVFQSIPSEGTYPDSSIHSATINNSTYIFMVEKTSGVSSGNFNVPSVGDLTIGVYKFNPTDMSVSRRGSILVQSAGMEVMGKSGYFTVVSSDSDSVYPFIAVPRIKKSGTTNLDDGVDFYGVKDVVVNGGDITPQPSMNLPAVTTWPIPVGGIVVNNWPFNGFLKSENGKVNLYSYRNAFYYNGKGDTTNGISQTVLGPNSDLGPATSPTNFFWGNPTIRVDRVDVTALTGSGSGGGPSVSCLSASALSLISNQQLRVGSKGEAVVQLQLILGITADGIFGPQTNQAVINFQLKNGIKADGIVGPITSLALTVYCKQGFVKITYSTPIPTTSPTYSVPASAPVLKTVAGPTSLNINQEGTWTFTATDANNDDLSWSVDWGEGNSVETCQVNPPLGTAQGWSYSASHSWTTTGNHRVTVFANDCHGGRSQSSFNVSVN